MPLMKKVLWTGAIPDLSGYASASREYVRSLDAVGVDVAVDAVSFEPWKPEPLTAKILDQRMYQLMCKDRGAPIHIIHLTPDNWRQYANNGRRHIGYFAWETSKLPGGWVRDINECSEEVWVPCDYLVKVCQNSGVKRPTYAIPHAIPVPPDDWVAPISCAVPQDRFKFYSIFQWSERKFPAGLITAYYQEFSIDDPVALVLKTYRRGDSPGDRNLVKKEISTLKRQTKGIKCPPIFLFDTLMDPDSVMSMHAACDAYVAIPRSEGFGIPAFEAASFGKPVIVSKYSAFPEYFTDKTAYFVDVPHEIPVRGMRHISILYTPDMKWGDPSVESCRQQMRHVFEHQDEARAKGQAARDYVKEQLNYEKIGRMMSERLEKF